MPYQFMLGGSMSSTSRLRDDKRSAARYYCQDISYVVSADGTSTDGRKV